jgi:HSP20 family molecular chaperone IbpA
VDILEDNSEILLLADMPGVEMDAVDVQAQPGSLVVSGMQSSAVQPRAQFSRTFHLPRSVDGAQIQATMSDGVLRLRLPKRTRVTPRQIQVKAEPQS